MQVDTPERARGFVQVPLDIFFRRDIRRDRYAPSRQRLGDPPRAVAVDVDHDDQAPFA
jgi:hypothetical protein